MLSYEVLGKTNFIAQWACICIKYIHIEITAQCSFSHIYLLHKTKTERKGLRNKSNTVYCSDIENICTKQANTGGGLTAACDRCVFVNRSIYCVVNTALQPIMSKLDYFTDVCYNNT